MGLERLAMVLQGKNSNYDTDIFKPIIDSLESISNKKYLSSNLDDSQIKVNIAFRVIVDHLGIRWLSKLVSAIYQYIIRPFNVDFNSYDFFNTFSYC